MGLRDRVWPGLRGHGLVLECILASVALVGLVVGSPPSFPVLHALLGGAAALLLLLFRRTAPLLPFVAGALLTALTLSMATPMVLGAYALGRYTGSWRVRGTAGVIGAAAVVVGTARTDFFDALSILVYAALLLVLPAAIGVWQRTREQLVAALRERAERAEAERELLARDTVLLERTRIAREMHDVVGHRVSLMVLQAGAIELAAGTPEVELLAGQVQTAGRRALEELRQMIGVLRAEDVDEAAPLGPQPGLEDLPRLVAQAREAGMVIDLTCPEDNAVAPVVGRAAYRIVQEALTNAGKHAPGAPVDLTVGAGTGHLVLQVANGPATRAVTPVPGTGFGLVGVAERVRTLDGRFTAESRLDGGFRVEAVLPSRVGHDPGGVEGGAQWAT